MLVSNGYTFMLLQKMTSN